MILSRVEASKMWPCWDCEAQGGEECVPRQPDDANWVHGGRTALLDRILADPYAMNLLVS